MLPDVQLSLRPGIVEFGWGHPHTRLLPVAGLAEAAALALRRHGRQALCYGAEQGPGYLLEILRGWLACQEGIACPADQIFVTGGVSQALDLLCTLLTRPDDTVLVESPTYHLALRIFRDHGLRLVSVASDEDGLSVDALADTLEFLRVRDQSPRFLYLVPTFNNPSGATMPLARRLRLLSLVEQAGLLVVEDDVYHELWYDSPPPLSLFGLAPAGLIVCLGSFSKLLAPGLRLGWLLARPEIVQRCVQSGVLDSGGGINHFTACVVAAYMELGLLDGHLKLLRNTYRQHRDKLVDALATFLPRNPGPRGAPSWPARPARGTLARGRDREVGVGCSWRVPGGGFFVWLSLPARCDSTTLLSAAEAAGVSYVPGERFCHGGGGESYARLAFSLLSPPELEEGARRLGRVLGAAQGLAPEGDG